MGRVTSVQCWFEIDGKRYGPATSDLKEEIIFTGRIKTIKLSGTFMLSQDSQEIFWNFDSNSVVQIHLDDGRWAAIIFSQIINGQRGSFKINGDWQNAHHNDQ